MEAPTSTTRTLAVPQRTVAAPGGRLELAADQGDDPGDVDDRLGRGQGEAAGGLGRVDVAEGDRVGALVPSIRTVQVNLVPLARRTWSGQVAAPTSRFGLLRFWVLTSSRSTSAVPTSWSWDGLAAGFPAPPQAARSTARTRARRRALTLWVSAGAPDRCRARGSSRAPVSRPPGLWHACRSAL